MHQVETSLCPGQSWAAAPSPPQQAVWLELPRREQDMKWLRPFYCRVVREAQVDFVRAVEYNTKLKWWARFESLMKWVWSSLGLICLCQGICLSPLPFLLWVVIYNINHSFMYTLFQHHTYHQSACFPQQYSPRPLQLPKLPSSSPGSMPFIDYCSMTMFLSYDERSLCLLWRYIHT